MKIKVNVEKPYEIIIKRGLLSEISKYINDKRVFLISNKTVYPLYKKFFQNIKYVILIDDGEKYKNFKTCKYILDELLRLKIHRDDLILTLGGGVVGDIAGFCASTVLRGVDLIHIPTTLLAQIDSSIGGKTGIDTDFGKNLIGTFYQPKCVLIDTDTLKTLDKKQLKAGFGEAVKYAFIEKNCMCDNNFFEFLSDFDFSKKSFDGLVFECAKMKANVVSFDEKEKSKRMFLNFGHTISHGIEFATNYKILHGIAVSMGIKVAFKIALQMNLISANYFESMLNLLQKFDLNLDVDKKIDKNLILKGILQDKKIIKNKLNLILPISYKKAKRFEIDDFNLILNNL